MFYKLLNEVPQTERVRNGRFTRKEVLDFHRSPAPAAVINKEAMYGDDIQKPAQALRNIVTQLGLKPYITVRTNRDKNEIYLIKKSAIS